MTTVPLVNLVPDEYPRTKDGYLIKPGDRVYDADGTLCEIISVFKEEGEFRVHVRSLESNVWGYVNLNLTTYKPKLTWLDEQINDYRRHYEFHKSRNNREESRICEGALKALTLVKDNLDKCKP